MKLPVSAILIYNQVDEFIALRQIRTVADLRNAFHIPPALAVEVQMHIKIYDLNDLLKRHMLVRKAALPQQAVAQR